MRQTLVTDGARLRELAEKLRRLKTLACLSLITSGTLGAVAESLPGLERRLHRVTAALLEGMHRE